MKLLVLINKHATDRVKFANALYASGVPRSRLFTVHHANMAIQVDVTMEF